MLSISDRFYNALAGLSLSGALANLSPRAQVVLFALLVRVNHKAGGVAWPSMADLAKRTGIKSRVTLQKAVCELEAAGLIVCDRRNGKATRYVVGAEVRTCMEKDPHPITRVIDREAQPDHPGDHEPKENGLNLKKNNNKRVSSFSSPEEETPASTLSPELSERLRRLGVRASMRVCAYGEEAVSTALDALEVAKGVRNRDAWMNTALKEQWAPPTPKTSKAVDALAEATQAVIVDRSQLAAKPKDPATHRRQVLAMLASRCNPALPPLLRRTADDPKTLEALERNGLTLSDLRSYLAAPPEAEAAV